MKKILTLGLILFFLSCGKKHPNVAKNRINLPATSWRFTLDLNGDLLPFNGTFSDIKDYSATLTLINADEEIVIDDVQLQNDSVIVPLPFFNTEMKLSIESPYMLSGVWTNNDKENYHIPLNAEEGQNFRFTPTGSDRNVPSKYFARFELGTETEYPAILILENNRGNLTGTFLTETGDYRYLEGNVMNGSIHLSTFDGSHAFYFRADISGDSLINGLFKSGRHYQTNWEAVADSASELKNPDEISFVIEDQLFDFELPNQDGEIVNWDKSHLNGKVVVLDIMGTWCPNCMDASRALKELSKPYSEDDLVVLPVLFEYQDDLAKAKNAFSKYSEELNIPEKFLFGGRASKKIANEKFPMLNSISSFPTLVFIGRDRHVAQVYTGFYGPGTGDYYTDFIESKQDLLQTLVNNK
ncbi:TlpA disulfide reductase family protein [Cryomorphaceae bacterium 1068]|nr:TlpA disulfide reductase family protein [Cryomorphaceae bacterium 1068]